MTTNTKTETDNIKTEYSSIFGSGNKVGDSGMITDGTYNVRWIIYTISSNTYQLFPMKNLTEHVMNSTDSNTGEYEGSDMYSYIHNDVLSNLRRSGLNITSCDLVSKDVYNDICLKTDIASVAFAGGEHFWLTDPSSSGIFCLVYNNGSITDSNADYSFGVRPLITVVK